MDETSIIAEQHSHRDPLFMVVIEGKDYKARVVLDSLVKGTSSGGVRIGNEVTGEEVSTLSREMTHKYSFYRLNRGGAKTGISVPAGTGQDQLGKILEDFGKRLGPLIRAGVYYPGMDMGCGPKELREIYRGAGFEIGEITDTSYFTALSVRESILAFVETRRMSGGPIRLAIEGFGRVATHLMRMLPESIYQVVSFSTAYGGRIDPDGFPTQLLLDSRQQHGDEMVVSLDRGDKAEPTEVLCAPVDILVPSARTFSIRGEHVDKIKAEAIIPIANAPYQAGAAETLHRRGVLCFPGFVTNGGGVFGSGLFDRGVSIEQVNKSTAVFYSPLVRALLETSQQTRVSAIDLARNLAERYLAIASRSGRKGRRERLAEAARRRLQPRSLGALLALKQFERSMSDIGKELKRSVSDDRA